LKIARALGPEVIEQLHRQVIEVAKRAGVTHGRRFRIDTTVVATNVHYPTDSTLLGDGVRVLTRTLQRASAALGDPAGQIRNRLRSVTRRVLIIGYEARSPKTRDAMVKSYRTLMATTRAVLRDTTTMVRRLSQRVRTAQPQVQPMLQHAQDRLQELRPLVHELNLMLARLGDAEQASPQELLADLTLLEHSLQQAGARHVAEIDVRPAAALVRSFGFHLAALDVRQNSAYHDRAIGGLIEAAGLPRTPASSGKPLMRRIISLALSRSTGASRRITSFSTST
jgi:hypothetical protein